MKRETERDTQRVINWIVLNKRLNAVIVPVLNLLRIAVALVLIAGLLLLNKYLISNSSVDNENIVRYLEVLKWPILAFAIYLLFRKELPSVLKRIIKIGKDGVELSPDQEAQVEVKKPELTSEDVNSSKSSNPDVTSKEGRAQLLTDYRLKWLLERIYRIIFGTQIEAMWRLYNYSSGLSADDLNDLYEKHLRLFPDTNYSNIIQLMNYPQSNNLVEYNPAQRVFKITDLGCLFLEYLESENLLNPIQRPN